MCFCAPECGTVLAMSVSMVSPVFIGRQDEMSALTAMLSQAADMSGPAAARALCSRTLSRPTPRAVAWASREGAVRVGDHGFDGLRLVRAWPASPAESQPAEKSAR
jgi:hypothetical protein